MKPVLYLARLNEVFVIALINIVFIIIFIQNPELDIAFSSLFFKPSDGFIYSFSLNGVSANLFFLAKLAVLTIMFFFTVSFFSKFEFLKNFRFIFCVILIGSGLFVNFGLKNSWGRARPEQITQFGGKANYSSPLSPSDQCQKNCSFVSGHAIIGYSLMLFGAFSGKRFFWLSLGSLAGISIGAVRILEGKHFLSDVLFGFLPMWLAAELTGYIFYFLGLARLSKTITTKSFRDKHPGQNR